MPWNNFAFFLSNEAVVSRLLEVLVGRYIHSLHEGSTVTATKYKEIHYKSTPPHPSSLGSSTLEHTIDAITSSLTNEKGQKADLVGGIIKAKWIKR
jgi:hypothetical protein